MKRIFMLLAFLLPVAGFSQDYPHYTMFMFNKLLYNPGYAGSRNALSINGAYRNQWTGIEGAPINLSLAVDGPIGSYTKSFRPVALGLSVNKENTGPVDNTDIGAYYAYRLRMSNSVLSLGLRAGVSVYSARYSDLNPIDQGDQMLENNINNAILPNFGAGAYWSSKRYYIGLSVPNFLENYYDKNQQNYLSGKKARQIRTLYLSGGYTFPVSEHVTLLPQVIARYNSDGTYKLPFNADLNMTVVLYQRIMIGATYRTDQSLEGIVHVQIAKKVNIGYSYDYSLTSDLNRYSRGAHEITIGFDFLKDLNDYADPRFIKNF